MRNTLIILGAAAAAAAFDHSYQTYGAFLDRHVCEDGVNYEAVVADTATAAIAQRLSSVGESQFDSFGKDQQLAYLINVYNFYTIELIKEHYPLEVGIRDIGKPWDRRFVPLFGDTVSLDHVEHGIIREEYSEPRIHFALNCASKGCPSLLDEPYTAEKLDRQLDRSATAFLTDDSRNRVEGNKLYLSEIFKWYGGDFRDKHGGYVDYVKKKLNLKGRYRVKFLEYDWSLNDAKGCGK